MSFSARGKSRHFFMPKMNPFQLFRCPDRVGNAVERVAGDAVNPPNSRRSQNIDQQISYLLLRHASHPSWRYGCDSPFALTPTSQYTCGLQRGTILIAQVSIPGDSAGGSGSGMSRNTLSQSSCATLLGALGAGAGEPFSAEVRPFRMKAACRRYE